MGQNGERKEKDGEEDEEAFLSCWEFDSVKPPEENPEEDNVLLGKTTAENRHQDFRLKNNFK